MALSEQKRSRLLRLIEPKVLDLVLWRRRILAGRLGLEWPADYSTLSDETLIDLADYFDVGEKPDAAWPKPGLRLFVSHIAQMRGNFAALQTALAAAGANFFLAHANIEGGAEWRRALVTALDNMDALIAIHSVGFRVSYWCNQEVGYALARKIPVIRIMDGEPPPGFLDDIQGFQFVEGAEAELVAGTLRTLNSDGGIPDRLGESLGKALKYVGSFAESDRMIARLEEARELNDAAVRQITLAFRFNDQVYKSGALVSLGELLERHGRELVAPEQVAGDENPDGLGIG